MKWQTQLPTCLRKLAIRAMQKDSTSKYYSSIKNEVRKLLVGHDHAVDIVIKQLELVEAGLTSADKPNGAFLLAGPTGCGKTLLVKAVAYALHGTPDKLIRIDCGEYQNEHEIAKLLGAPPGYLGHTETKARVNGQAIKACVSESSSTVILLFDEVEKAAPSLHDLLLGVLDTGMITLGDNRPVDVSNALIFMTSNLGGKNEGQTEVGFVRGKERELSKKTTSKAIDDYFRPEFLNRLTATIFMKQLTKAQCVEVAGKELDKYFSACPLNVKVSEEAITKVVETGWSPRFGARSIVRVIEDSIMHPIAVELLDHHYNPIITTIEVAVEDEDFTFAFMERANENVCRTANTKHKQSSK